MNTPTTVWIVSRRVDVGLSDEWGSAGSVRRANVSVSIEVWDVHSVHAREESARCVAAEDRIRFRVEQREVQA
jgi:hypothetical protein